MLVEGEPLYVVKCCLKSKPEEVKGGSPIDRVSAEAWVKKLNKEYPAIRHWTELVDRRHWRFTGERNDD